MVKEDIFELIKDIKVFFRVVSAAFLVINIILHHYWWDNGYYVSESLPPVLSLFGHLGSWNTLELDGHLSK